MTARASIPTPSVPDAIALDASPLILLSRAGKLDLLVPLAPEIVVPEPVVREIMAKGSDDVTVRAVGIVTWLKVVPSPAIPDAIRAWDLGEGETSVLAWAYQRSGASAVLDDLEGRRCANSLGIGVLGTVAVVLRAKRRGQIALARPVLEDLIRAGMYISNHTLAEVLRRTEE